MIQGSPNNRSAMDLITELEGKVRNYKAKYHQEMLVNSVIPWVIGVIVGAVVMAVGLRMGWWRL